MNLIRKTIKSNAHLMYVINKVRGIIGKSRGFSEFIQDGFDFSRFYLKTAEKNGNYDYRIMLIVHSLEKGMCMQDLRPFGRDKVILLVEILKKYDFKRQSGFEYQLGLSALQTWVAFFEEQGWNNEPLVKTVKQYLIDNPYKPYNVGYKVMKNPTASFINKDSIGSDIFLSRYTVRDFGDKDIAVEDLDFALQCFSQTPTACNRQMCKIYMIKSEEHIKLLHNKAQGIGGINLDNMKLFLVTYDIASLDRFGVRNQGYLNAGLTAMNFVNGLHCRGIGTCFMQWGNTRKQDQLVRQALKLPKSERIAVLIGAGYYKDETKIPCSCRKPMEDVFKII